jgi:ribosomal protein L3
MFEVVVAVTGFTIDRTMGTMRAHGNSRLMTHGSKSHRLQGSGAVHHQDVFSQGKKCLDVIEKNTISGLEIIDIDTKENLLVKGSIPGKSGNLVSIQKLIKTSIYGK